MAPYIHITIPTYSLMAGIGGFLALILLYLRAGKFLISFSTFLQIMIVSVFGIFVGSKLLFAFTQIPWLVNNFSFENLILLIPRSGYVFYGGLLGMLLSVRIFVKMKGLSPQITSIYLAPAIPLFHAFGRIGCFLSGCCYGKELESPIELFDITIYRIPVQLLESAYEFILFGVIIVVSRKKKDINVLKLYLVLYAAFRFIIEFFRGDIVRGIFLGISTSQWISIIILAVVFVQWNKDRNNNRTSALIQ